jgi:hypothetical protein
VAAAQGSFVPESLPKASKSKKIPVNFPVSRELQVETGSYLTAYTTIQSYQTRWAVEDAEGCEHRDGAATFVVVRHRHESRLPSPHHRLRAPERCMISAVPQPSAVAPNDVGPLRSETIASSRWRSARVTFTLILLLGESLDCLGRFGIVRMNQTS